ncbi:MAG: 1,2-phenylacetyl-CoA epoxidase subunit PaaC [Candidatus Dormibacteria bacterium]
MSGLAGRALYALRLGDDCLVLAQQLGSWSARAPQLEEDIALTNIGLDLLGQARSLLSHAGELEGTGRDEDALAYLRDEREFVNCQLVELDNGNFAQTIARQLLFSTYQLALYRELSGSSDPVLAAVAAKGAKEADYHRDHATQWTLRLGDGTAESHLRMQRAVDMVWPYGAELFEGDELTDSLAREGVAVAPLSLRAPVDAFLDSLLAEATLRRPEGRWTPRGGRQGLHTEALGYLLAEMQHLHRAHPGATW